jgi:adenylate kinase family enzyme
MRFHEIQQDISEGPYDPHIFKAVFMAGSPGAGKTTISRKLFAGTGLKTLNVDEFWQFYQRTGRQGNYDRFWELYKAKEAPIVDQKLGLIIDGTGKNSEVIKTLKKSLESQGYDCIMIYVSVDLNTTIKRAQQRAEDPKSSDYGRHIDPEFITTTWNRVNQGRNDLERIFGNQFYEVDNSDRPELASLEKTMRKWLSQPPKNSVAVQWLSQNRNKPIAQRPLSPRTLQRNQPRTDQSERK